MYTGKAKASLYNLVESTRRYDPKRVERTPYIDVEIINVIPYFGTKSILFSSRSTSGTVNLQYPTVIAFYNIEFLFGVENWRRGMLKFENPELNQIVVCEQPDYRRTPVRVYCGCFTGDTKISLLDGREVPIKDLVGLEEFWVYSCTKEGDVVPGRAHNAHVTRKNAEIIKITLDSGDVIRCTPDHLFLLKDGTYKEAKDLLVTDSLMPLYRKISTEIDNPRLIGYEMFKNPKTGVFRFTHHMVGDFNSQQVDGLIFGDNHHIDFNKLNNTPSNLTRMLHVDHSLLHSLAAASLNSERMKADNPMFNEESVQKMVETQRPMRSSIHAKIAKANSESGVYEAMSNRMIKDAVEGNHPMQSEENRENMSRIQSSKVLEGQHLFQKSHPLKNPECVRKAKISKIVNCMLKVLEKGEDLNEQSYELVKPGGTTKWTMIDSILPLEEALKLANSKYDKINKAINHKIVRIEDAGTEDVYCFSVDEHHNYALSAGVFVHNCPDFYYSFAYPDFHKECYYGTKPKPYKRVMPPSNYPKKNPDNIPGLCKHELNLINVLIKQGYVK